jgi:hypothetical protein
MKLFRQNRRKIQLVVQLVQKKLYCNLPLYIPPNFGNPRIVNVLLQRQTNNKNIPFSFSFSSPTISGN